MGGCQPGVGSVGTSLPGVVQSGVCHGRDSSDGRETFLTKANCARLRPSMATFTHHRLSVTPQYCYNKGTHYMLFVFFHGGNVIKCCVVCYLVLVKNFDLLVD